MPRLRLDVGDVIEEPDILDILVLLTILREWKG
jgi:hypothetical protein